MFDLDKSIAAWRRRFEHDRTFLREDVRELEQHVRDQVAALVAAGASPEEAFLRVMQDMGGHDEITAAYRSVLWGKLRRKHRRTREFIWRTSMLKNYLKVALRNLRRRKVYAFINVSVLAVGLACCLQIGLYVYHEWSYDRFHDKADRIYRIVSDLRTPAEHLQLLAPGALAPALQADFPEVLQAVRFTPARFLIAHGDRRFQEDGLLYADSTVFEVFDFPLLRGNPGTALAGPYQIVLTPATARKYFGAQDPIGQVLTVDGVHTMTVTGVLAEVPANSHLRFDGLISMATLASREGWRFESFISGVNMSTYVLLPEGYPPQRLEAGLPDFVRRHTQRHFEENGFQHEVAYVLEPLTEIYLNPPRMGESRPVGSATNPRIFSAAALFVLLIACINFTNLATARAADRAGEIGVRKVVGARRGELVVQFLSESVLLAGFATVLALGLVLAALPAFRTLSGVPLSVRPLLEPASLLGLAGVAVLVGLAAGSYPSLVLSRFRPASVLKGTFRTSSRGVLLRKGLVVLQFGISVALITGTAVVFSQVDYLRRQRLGFHQEQMLVIDFHGDPVVRRQAESIKRQLAAHPAVADATVSAYVPGAWFDSFGRTMETGNGVRQSVSLKTYEVDYDFLSVFGLDLLAGRNFSLDFPGDSTRALILNEAAAAHLGFARPEDAVGAVWGWGSAEPTGRIIGVVADFHFQSLHTPVEPLAIQFLRFNPRYLTLRVQTDRMQETVASLERTWQALVPNRPFDYSFLDERFAAQYRADERFGAVFGTFAGLAILIACLGLFGLVSFTVQQRTKEIGVRKVLGASAASIVLVLTKDFVRLVLVALVLAVPFTYVGMQRWLERFAYRIDLGVGVFLASGALMLLIVLLTVVLHTAKAARADPVKSLRYE